MRTAEQRLIWKMERKALEGETIRDGKYEGYQVIEHIDGSLYSIREPLSSVRVLVSHNKQTDTWRPWK